MRVLYHKTSYYSMLNFLLYGGLKTSDLFLNESERNFSHELSPRLAKKLYFMSFARSLLSNFLNSDHTQVIIHIDADRLRQYGSISPFHYHNLATRVEGRCNHAGDEMEERLFTDLPFLPLDVIIQVDLEFLSATLFDKHHWACFTQTMLLTQLVKHNVKFNCYTSGRAVRPVKDKLPVEIVDDHISVFGMRVDRINEREIKPARADNSQMVFDFLFNDIRPTKYSEVVDPHIPYMAAMPGVGIAFSETKNFISAENFNMWHKIRVTARERNMLNCSEKLLQLSGVIDDIVIAHHLPCAHAHNI